MEQAGDIPAMTAFFFPTNQRARDRLLSGFEGEKKAWLRDDFRIDSIEARKFQDITREPDEMMWDGVRASSAVKVVVELNGSRKGAEIADWPLDIWVRWNDEWYWVERGPYD